MLHLTIPSSLPLSPRRMPLTVITWQYMTIAGIFLASLAGFFIPVYTNILSYEASRGPHHYEALIKHSRSWKKSMQFFISFFVRGFASGVIFSVAVMHLLPDAWNTILDVCDGTSDIGPGGGVDPLENDEPFPGADIDLMHIYK